MAEDRRHHLQRKQLLLHNTLTQCSRLGELSSAGDIVKVQGGHIVRATGRKDRHSKVCTAKGPRDRRVRLSAHTAIQFYDVQDRLGYDRPSKAVDWLMEHARAAIDQLAELPPWRPAAAASSPPPAGEGKERDDVADHTTYSSSWGFGGSCILPPSLDSDAIADTIRSFFRATDVAASASSSPMIGGVQIYPPDLLSRTSSSHAQDLRLSLQSFQDTTFLHHQRSAAAHHPTSPTTNQGLYSNSSASFAFDAALANWSEHSQRMVSWDIEERGGGDDANGSAYMVHSPLPPLHSMLGLSSFLPPRGTLQSSNSPWVRALMDPVNAGDPIAPLTCAATERPSGGFSEYHIPARIAGDKEELNGVSNGPSSASSASRH